MGKLLQLCSLTEKHSCLFFFYLHVLLEQVCVGVCVWVCVWGGCVWVWRKNMKKINMLHNLKQVLILTIWETVFFRGCNLALLKILTEWKSFFFSKVSFFFLGSYFSQFHSLYRKWKYVQKSEMCSNFVNIILAFA